jgi:asparagine synthase (glutamine-hydrolysing)
MCGIAGILISPRRGDPRRLSAVKMMTDILRHRGPDSGDAWIDPEEGIALGHRRLAIVDLSDAGRQPMWSASGQLVVSYNGEIYNFQALRSELEQLGHRFRGHSDTEVMLAAFTSWGVEPALTRFAGMFAIALWDRRRRALLLARDRMGKKPLYASIVAGALVFASELKAIRALPEFEPDLNSAAVEDVLTRGWIDDRRCIWRNVVKVPPGTCMTIMQGELDGLDIERLRHKARAWWSLAEIAVAADQTSTARGDNEIEAELDTLLRSVVRERMVADVPLGAFLSGGIDSAAVVAVMQAQSSRPIRTFTMGFSEDNYDEAPNAARVAQYLGTDHTEFIVSHADAYATIPELPQIWDEPFADESQIPTLLVSRLARQHVTVVLTGDGGDECFGGYSRHVLAARHAMLDHLPRPIRRFAAAAMLAVPVQRWSALMSLLRRATGGRFTREGGDIHKLARVMDAVDDKDLYERLIAFGQLPPKEMTANDDMPPLGDRVSRSIYRDMVGYLPGDILVKLDRATMAASLEGRCPFLDHRVVEFAWKLPHAAKIRNGKGKWVLRRVLARYLPRPLFERPKHGFNVPIGAWLRGPLRDWAESLLSAAGKQAGGLIDAGQTLDNWREHLAGRRDHSGGLWAVLMLQAWLEHQRARATTVPTVHSEDLFERRSYATLARAEDRSPDPANDATRHAAPAPGSNRCAWPDRGLREDTRNHTTGLG